MYPSSARQIFNQGSKRTTLQYEAATTVPNKLAQQQPQHSSATSAPETRLLDAEEVVAVLVGDEVDGQTKVPEPSGAADAVQVRLGVLGEVEVDHNVDRLDVDTAGEQVCTTAAAAAAAEVCSLVGWLWQAVGVSFQGGKP